MILVYYPYRGPFAMIIVKERGKKDDAFMNTNHAFPC